MKKRREENVHRLDIHRSPLLLRHHRRQQRCTPSTTHSERVRMLNATGIPSPSNVHRRLVATSPFQRPRLPRPSPLHQRYVDGRHQTRQTRRPHQLPRTLLLPSRRPAEPRCHREQLAPDTSRKQTGDAGFRPGCDYGYHGDQGGRV